MGTNILLASPNEESRKLASQVLEATEFELLTATSIQEATKAWKKNRIGIFLCSIQIAEPDEAFQLLKDFKDANKDSKSIILLPEGCPNQLKFAARKSGVSGWLLDPLETKSFVGLIKRLMV